MTATTGKRPMHSRLKSASVKACDTEDCGITANEYHEADRNTFTGLLNHLGEPIYREPEPFGFHPHPKPRNGNR